MRFIVRTERMPVVEVVYPATFDWDEYRELFALYVQLSAANPRIGYIIDMRKFDPLRAPAGDRKRAAEIFNQHVARMVGATVCEARVVDNQITRGIVTAFDWLTGTKWPCANFVSLPDADDWVVRQLARGEGRSGGSDEPSRGRLHL